MVRAFAMMIVAASLSWSGSFTSHVSGWNVASALMAEAITLIGCALRGNEPMNVRKSSPTMVRWLISLMNSSYSPRLGSSP